MSLFNKHTLEMQVQFIIFVSPVKIKKISFYPIQIKEKRKIFIMYRSQIQILHSFIFLFVIKYTGKFSSASPENITTISAFFLPLHIHFYLKNLEK